VSSGDLRGLGPGQGLDRDLQLSKYNISPHRNLLGSSKDENGSGKWRDSVMAEKKETRG